MFWTEPLGRHCLRLYVCLSAVQLVFAVWPQIDLWVSSWFYVPGEGFPLDDVEWLQRLRLWIRVVVAALFATALASLAAAALKRPGPVPARVWGAIAALYLLGPMLLVNGILKEVWERGRPADVSAFGGDGAFTPPFEMAGPCASNCSFTSGEGAGVAAFALSVVWLAPWLRARWARRVALALAIALFALGSGLRIAMGRHFLSDTLFSALFVAAIWSLLGRALQSPRP